MVVGPYPFEGPNVESLWIEVYQPGFLRHRARPPKSAAPAIGSQSWGVPANQIIWVVPPLPDHFRDMPSRIVRQSPPDDALSILWQEFNPSILEIKISKVERRRLSRS